MRGRARHFRSGVDTMIREAELEEMQAKWAAENARIMAEHPMLPDPDAHAPPDVHPIDDAEDRSEEHTSELQSLMRSSYAVFCLKKKKILNDIKTDKTKQNKKY